MFCASARGPGEAHPDQLGVQHPAAGQVDVGEPVPVRPVSLPIELELDQEPALEGAPRVLERALAGPGLDADQADALEAPAQPDLHAVGTESADEAGREPSSCRLDFLREEPRDLAQRESHDPAEAPEADLSCLEPEPVDLDHHAARQLKQMRAVAQGGWRGVGRGARTPGRRPGALPSSTPRA